MSFLCPADFIALNDLPYGIAGPWPLRLSSSEAPFSHIAPGVRPLLIRFAVRGKQG